MYILIGITLIVLIISLYLIITNKSAKDCVNVKDGSKNISNEDSSIKDGSKNISNEDSSTKDILSLIDNMKKAFKGKTQRTGSGMLGVNSSLSLINSNTGELQPGKVYLIIITSSPYPIYGIFIVDTTTSQINKLLSTPTLSMAFNSLTPPSNIPKVLYISTTPIASISEQFSVNYNIITLN